MLAALSRDACYFPFRVFTSIAFCLLRFGGGGVVRIADSSFLFSFLGFCLEELCDLSMDTSAPPPCESFMGAFLFSIDEIELFDVFLLLDLDLDFSTFAPAPGGCGPCPGGPGGSCIESSSAENGSEGAELSPGK